MLLELQRFSEEVVFILKVRINEQIRDKEVRLIGDDGTQIGVVSIKEALEKAEELGVDVVEVAPSAKPPVCKLMDFGKYKYQQTKKEKESKKKQTFVKIKEMTFSPTIEKHDYEFKKRHIINFIGRGDKVKVTVNFRGREVTHLEFGRAILERIKDELKDIADVEKKPDMEGRKMIMVLMPKPRSAKHRESKPTVTPINH
ncbi:MAG: translation initiation factor IF-3 [Candidatus Hydrogenedentota bacterium]